MISHGIIYKSQYYSIDSYSFDHSKTSPVHRNPRWWLFGQIWNGRAVWFWNAIQNQSHSKAELIWYSSHQCTRKTLEIKY